MYHFRRPSTDQLAALLAESATGELSYADVGISLGAPVPPGYHRLHASRELGTDGNQDLFAAGRRAIEAWAGHARAGAILEPPRPELSAGSAVALALRVGPLWVTAACRVVTVIDEVDRYGFAYGTLHHHPERGEEAFLVTRDPSTGLVTLEISACSRANSILTRLGGPIGRWFQHLMARRYLDGFEAVAMASAP